MRRFGLMLMGGLAGTAIACGGGGDGGNGPGTITSVVVSGDSTVVLAGTRQLTATAMSGNTPVSTGVTFQWSSSDTTRSTVSASGLVTGVRLGSSNVAARAVLDGTPTSVSSSAHAMRTRIGSIFINPGDFTSPYFGAAALLRAQARDAQSVTIPGVAFTWISRAPSVVSVTPHPDSSHLANLLATANGIARIVFTGDGVSDSITVTVHQEATSLGLTPISFNYDRINRGDSISVVALDGHSFPLDDSLITWTSRNTGVATVNTTGINNKRVIRSVNEGQTRVVARAGALGDSVDVTVNLIYSSVQITTSGPLPAPLDSALIFRLNGSLQLGMIVRDVGNTIVPNPQNFAWSLKHPGTIATIGTTTGLVTGNSNAGTDTIVLVARGIPDTVPLVVRQVLASINVTPASPAALNFVGDTQTFAAEPRDSGGAAIPGQTITWSTNNAALGIDAAGLATAIQRTSAAGVVVKVKATVGTFTDSSRSIVVKQVPASANLDPNSFGTLTAFGRQASASCVVLDSAADTIPNHLCTWSAGTAGVVSFNPTTAKTTTVTAIGNGNTTIQAQAAPSLFGFNSITVDQVAASISLFPVNFGTPNVTMKVSQAAPFWIVVRDSANNVDTRARSDVAWSIAPGTSASVSASTSDATTVTTNTFPGSETVQATIGAISAQRVVAVSTSGISFGTSVQPIFNANCTECHAGANPPRGMSLAAGAAYSNIFNQTAGEAPSLKRVRAFRPDSSYLVHKVQGTQATVGGSGTRMPPNCTVSSCLPDATINIIRNWILQGALNN